MYPTSDTSYSYVSLVPSTTATGWAFSAPVATSAGVHSGAGWIALLGDFDGDGAPDFLSIDPPSGSGNLYTSRTASDPTCTALSNGSICSRYHAHDVITRFTNGTGATTTVAYQPLTNQGVYQWGVDAARTRALNNATFGYGSPVFDVLAPLYVVSEAQSSAPTKGNPTAQSSVYYRYAGALMQAGGRGFLGFWETWSFDANDTANENNQYIVTVNGYGQEYPFIGVPEATFKLAFGGSLTRGNATLDACAVTGPEVNASCFAAVGAPAWPNLLLTGVMVGLDMTQPYCTGAGCSAVPAALASQCTTPATAAPAPDTQITAGIFSPPATPTPIFVYGIQSTQSQYELTSPPGIANALVTATAQNTMCYDGSATTPSRGDLLNSRTVTSSAAGVVAQKLLVNTYSDTVASWYLGRLQLSTVQFLRPSPTPAISRTTNYTYDSGTGSNNTGLLLSERVQQSGTLDQDLRTRYTLDGYGNRTGAYQCSAELSDTACTSTTSFTQQQSGTHVHRYAKTTYDAVGRYPTVNKLPFYSVGGSGHLNEQSALTIATRDEFGNATSQSSINGLTQTAEFGTLGRPYFAADTTGKASTTTYRTCGTGTTQVGCSSDAMLTFRAQTVTAGAPITWTYFDVLGRPVLKIAQAFDANPVNQNFTAVCTYRDSHDRPIYQSEPFFVPVGVATDGVSPNLPVTAPSPCASASYATTTQYDVLGRVTQILAPDNGTTVKSYTGLVTGTMNPRYFVWEETKNALGEVTETADPTVTGNPTVGLIVDTTYDAAGDVLTITRDALNNGAGTSTTKITTQFTYDALGRKQTQTDPDAGTLNFGYNAAGNVVSQTDARNQTITQAYDAMGRRWQRVAHGADGNTLTDTWTYDTTANGYGQLASEMRAATIGTAFSRSFSYDGFGRSSGRTTSIGGTPYGEVTAYDGYSRLMAQQDASGYSLTTNYSTHGFVDLLTDSRVGTLYQVNAMTARNQAASEKRGGSTALASTLTYTPSTGRLSTLCSGTGCGLQDLTYTFDLVGNLTQRERATSTAPTIEVFGNDALNRLTSAQLTEVQGVTQGTPIPTAALAYDLIGNLCTKNGTAYAYAGYAGCANHGSSGSPHAVTAVGTATYVYDLDGNQTTSNTGRTLAYNALNEVTTASAGSTQTAFQYGPDGDRFLRTDGSPVVWPAGCRTASDRIFCNGFDADQTGGSKTTHYVGNVESIQSGTATEQRRYLGGVAIDYVRSSGSSTSYLFADHLGSIDVVASSAGALIEAMSFDVHGNRRDPVNWQSPAAVPVSTTHGFTGHEHVDTFDFIHMNGRIYDPRVGRMLQADPLADGSSQGWNRYSYVVNNPLALTDPTGYFSWGSFLQDVAVIAITLYTGGWGATLWNAGSYAGAVAVVGAGGFVAGAVQTGNVRGALTGAFSAELFFGAGQYFDNASWAHDGGDIGATNLNGIGFTAKILAHGVAGGVMQSLEGGQFGNGFLSAGVAEAASPGIDSLDSQNPIGQSVSAERVLAASIVGGTTSVLAGGKFANGAITGAFGRAFNEESARFGKHPYSSDGGGYREYDQNDPNYHDYSVLSFICSTSQQFGCSAGYVFSEGLDRYPAPLMNGDYVSNRDILALPGLGPVRFQVFSGDKEVINETMPGHLLAPGYVDRQVMQVGDDVYIQTQGVGTGSGSDINAAAASVLWHSVDSQIARSLTLYPPTVIHP